MFNIKKRRRRSSGSDIDPDEIFLDSSNLPDFDTQQFEGRIVSPISKTSVIFLGAFFVCVVAVFLWKIGTLQIINGKAYADVSENNHLAYTFLFPKRGVVQDRNDELLAWNVPNEGSTTNDFIKRAYTNLPGLSHVLGYVKYPQADDSGNYYKTEYSGESGVEKIYNQMLNGENGLKIIEKDALLNVKSESVIDPPKDGADLTLSIDQKVQTKLYTLIESLVHDRGFEGGSGVIMDVHTGEILALTSYPEYDPTVMSKGEDRETIAGYNTNGAKPYLNRVISGRYTPGSIVKPFMAIGALNEGVVTPERSIFSSGELVLPNPYHPEFPSVFKDWQPQGWVDMRKAIAVSSDVYFYEIGGGFAPDNQKGMGIENIEKYARMFGIASTTGIDLPGEVDGVIPSPEWKAKNFNGEDWRVGDTYHTVIGQYGFQVTPIQMVRAMGALATDGMLVTPHVASQKQTVSSQIKGIDSYYYRVVREGMRRSVTEGTSMPLNVNYLSIGAKSGTAELGAAKNRVNSWIMGFFPYDKPKYAFVAMMENGPITNTMGAAHIMRDLFDWMYTENSQYLKE